jgi:hypothetical protein
MNGLKDFKNLDEIKNQKDMNTSVNYSSLKTPTISTAQIKSKNQSESTFNANNKNNTIIYIKDPSNKNAEIQHVIKVKIFFFLKLEF